LDATASGERLYGHFDFEPAYTVVRAKSNRAAHSLPELARRIEPADLPGILGRDRQVFGADRSELLGELLRRSPECARIVDGRGYSFGRPGYLCHQIGPVVAEDRETARALVMSCCASLPGQSVVIDAPQLDPAWLEWLRSAGFTVERPFARMFRRGDSPPGKRERQYAITGPEFA
jgi:hypothetical protein